MSSSPRRTDQARQTRANLLSAAHEIVAQHGVTGLALAKVATRAGISKGGLLHHFPTKEDLLNGMLGETMSALDDALTSLAEERSATPGAFGRAYLEFVLRPGDDTAAASSIFAAAAIGEGDLAAVRRQFAKWQKRLVEHDGLDETLAYLIRIVGDGLWLIDLFDLAPPSLAARTQVCDVVLSLATEHAQSTARSCPESN